MELSELLKELRSEDHVSTTTKPSRPIMQITPKLAWDGEEVILLPESGNFFRADDEPHIKVLAWLMQNQPHGRPLPLDREKIGQDCQLSAQEVREAVTRLIHEGDLEPATGRRSPESFIFRIQYHEEEKP